MRKLWFSEHQTGMHIQHLHHRIFKLHLDAAERLACILKEFIHRPWRYEPSHRYVFIQHYENPIFIPLFQ